MGKLELGPTVDDKPVKVTLEPASLHRQSQSHTGDARQRSQFVTEMAHPARFERATSAFGAI